MYNLPAAGAAGAAGAAVGAAGAHAAASMEMTTRVTIKENSFWTFISYSPLEYWVLKKHANI
jgi:hypothetical protein